MTHHAPSVSIRTWVSGEGEALIIQSPYNPQFVAALKASFGRSGAKYDANTCTWAVDVRNRAVVEALLMAHYGVSSTEGVPLVTVRLTFDPEGPGLWADKGPVMVLGRVLASAAGRDSGARVGDGVVLVSGAVRSGGSMRNWRTEITAGSVLLMHDVPKVVALAAIANAATEPAVSIMESEPDAGTALDDPFAADILRITREIEDTRTHLRNLEDRLALTTACGELGLMATGVVQQVTTSDGNRMAAVVGDNGRALGLAESGPVAGPRDMVLSHLRAADGGGWAVVECTTLLPGDPTVRGEDLPSSRRAKSALQEAIRAFASTQPHWLPESPDTVRTA